MNRPFAFELQRADGYTHPPIPNDGVVAECQAINLARANKETLIGVFPSPYGFHRMILARFD